MKVFITADELLNRRPSISLPGSKILLKAVQKIRPKIHIFGHIHETYGKYEKDGTVFANVSICTHRYEATNHPKVFTIQTEEK
jgi:Icc-related predicted phosphoesterase